MSKQTTWTEVIESNQSLFSLNIKEIWKYRDLVYMFVKRDFVTFYKQTILGPLWFLIQPLLSSIMFYFVFVIMAKTQTKDYSSFLFILSGQVIWSYFSDSLNKVSTVFTTNANMFGKVYFPRLVLPISITFSGLIKFGVQFLIFAAFLLYGILTNKNVTLTYWAFALPYLIVLMGMFALGLGMIFSSLTTKYKDLTFLLTFAISLYMYATPVVMPLEKFGEFRYIIELNPITAIFECVHEGFLGKSNFEPIMLVYSTISIVVIFCLGTLIFNKVEKGFMDTV